MAHEDVAPVGQVLEDDRAGRPAGKLGAPLAPLVAAAAAGGIREEQLVLFLHVPELGHKV